MTKKEKNYELQNKWQLKKNLKTSKIYHWRLKIQKKQVKITPEDINLTKNAKLIWITCLSMSPGTSMKNSLSKIIPKNFSFTYWKINQNHHNNRSKNY